jgi:hypothetical protein
VKGGDTKSILSYSEPYRALYRDSYFVFQYNFVQFFVEHLVDVSRVFDTDLQSVLVLAVVGQMELQARVRSNFHEDGEMPAGLLKGPPPRINASSIAEVTGIPRETVRRKLEGLAERRWVARDSKGLWHIATSGDMSPVRRELIDLDRRQAERISRYLGLMHAMAVEGRPPAGKIKHPTKLAAARSTDETD